MPVNIKSIIHAKTLADLGEVWRKVPKELKPMYLANKDARKVYLESEK
jgi:hypothetical protein